MSGRESAVGAFWAEFHAARKDGSGGITGIDAGAGIQAINSGLLAAFFWHAARGASLIRWQSPYEACSSIVLCVDACLCAPAGKPKRQRFADGKRRAVADDGAVRARNHAVAALEHSCGVEVIEAAR